MPNNKKQILLFLGSGATAGSRASKNTKDLPTDQNFFSDQGVSNLIYCWKEKYPAINFCRRKIPEVCSKSLFQTWNQLFIYRGLALAGILRETPSTLDEFKDLSNHKWPKTFEWRAQHYNLQFRLLGQCLLPLEYYLAELAIWDLRTLIKDMHEQVDHSSCVYQQLLNNLENNLGKIAGVVNLNYDTTFDDAKPTPYYYPGNNELREYEIPLIRPHGSLKWTSQSCWHLNQGWTGWSNFYKETSLIEMGYKSTGDSMLLDFRQPLIVPPAYFKEEVLGNSSMPGLQNPILRQQWQHLGKVLTDCDHWVFIGISFASGDDHLLWLLKKAWSCEKQISYIIKDKCHPIQNLQKFLGSSCSVKAYKTKTNAIDQFDELDNFKLCETSECNH